MNIPAVLLDTLACPACKSPVSANETESTLDCTNAECSLRYRVEPQQVGHDIPVMLVDEAIKPDA